MELTAEKVLEALQHVCADEDDGRSVLRHPFRDGEYIVAMDGKMAVRYKPADGETGFPEDTPGHPNTAKAFPDGDIWKLAVKFSAEEVKSLGSAYATWQQHLSDGVKRNPHDLPEYTCPCCGERVYKHDPFTLIDADEYDRQVDDLNGITFSTPTTDKWWLKGLCLAKFVHFVGAIGEKEVPPMYLGYGGRLLMSRKGQWECVIMLSRFDRRENSFKSIANVMVKG